MATAGGRRKTIIALANGNRIDLGAWTVYWADGHCEHLTGMEGPFLDLLVKAWGDIVALEALTAKIGGHLARVAIALREKIGDNRDDPVYVINVRGWGYKFGIQGCKKEVFLLDDDTPTALPF